MDNNLNSISKSVDTVNALIDKINSTCDALLAAFEFHNYLRKKQEKIYFLLYIISSNSNRAC